MFDSNKIHRRTFLGTMAALPLLRAADEYPQVNIQNQDLQVGVYLPDKDKGYYRAQRFDWAGMIAGLKYKGHSFYNPWYQRRDETVRDFNSQGAEIVAGSASGTYGPAEEFLRPVGFDTAKAGDPFVKVGVGLLTRPDDMNYNSYRVYPWADQGVWTVKTSKDAVEFQHVLKAGASGYGYDYRKAVRLTPSKPDMVFEHRLTNTGTKPIETSVFNHNFLVLDGAGPGPDLELITRYEMKVQRPPSADLAEISGNKMKYKKMLENNERVAFAVDGFGKTAEDYDFRIENRAKGVGMRIVGDKPLARAAFWSIRSTMAIEPFVDIAIAPGQSFDWKHTYTYYEVR